MNRVEPVYKLTLETSFGSVEFIVTEESLQLFLKKYFAKDTMLLNNKWVDHDEILEVFYKKEPYRLTNFDIKPKNERIY